MTKKIVTCFSFFFWCYLLLFISFVGNCGVDANLRANLDWKDYPFEGGEFRYSGQRESENMWQGMVHIAPALSVPCK